MWRRPSARAALLERGVPHLMGQRKGPPRGLSEDQVHAATEEDEGVADERQDLNQALDEEYLASPRHDGAVWTHQRALAIDAGEDVQPSRPPIFSHAIAAGWRR